MSMQDEEIQGLITDASRRAESAAKGDAST